MSLSNPSISVVATTYNHEKYIEEAVQSVLAQTCEDFELVVVDDGSTDRTGEIVRSIRDPRVRYIHQPNQGPSVATNTGVDACRGKYLAMMAGDDVLHPDRLRKQREAYERGPARVLFSGAEFIDDDGQPLAGDFYPEMFDDLEVSRAQFLERLFFAPSCTSPRWSGLTAFSELRVFLEAGVCDPALFQAGDLGRFVQLLKKYEFETLPDRLYKVRIRTGWENLSGAAPDKQMRVINEMYLVMKTYFEGIPTELFREAFRPHLINPDFYSDMERACEEAFLYLRTSRHLDPLIAVERLYHLLNDPEGAAVLKRAYRYDSISFADTLKKLDVAKLFAGSNSVVAVEQGDGWLPENMVRQPVNPHVPQFWLNFNLEQFSSPRTIAWVPFEEPRLGRIKVERFRYRDANDVVHDLAPASLSRHACTFVGGEHVFDSIDARLYFAPPGRVKQLEVSGRMELLPPAQTCARLASALAEKQATIDQLARQLSALTEKQATMGPVAHPFEDVAAGQLGRARRSLWSSLGRRARHGVRRLRGIFSP